MTKPKPKLVPLALPDFDGPIADLLGANHGTLDSQGRHVAPLLDDGVALFSIEHPPGLLDKIANAIRTGKLRL